jgi:hypothetical protein
MKEILPWIVLLLLKKTKYISVKSSPHKKKTYSQTSRLDNPEELQLHQNQKKIPFLTVLSLFAQCKMNYC